jgi:hypothetical protein
LSFFDLALPVLLFSEELPALIFSSWFTFGFGFCAAETPIFFDAHCAAVVTLTEPAIPLFDRGFLHHYSNTAIRNELFKVF